MEGLALLAAIAGGAWLLSRGQQTNPADPGAAPTPQGTGFWVAPNESIDPVAEAAAKQRGRLGDPGVGFIGPPVHFGLPPVGALPVSGPLPFGTAPPPAGFQVMPAPMSMDPAALAAAKAQQWALYLQSRGGDSSYPAGKPLNPPRTSPAMHPRAPRPSSADDIHHAEALQLAAVHQRIPDTPVGAPVAPGWAPGHDAPMPWDSAYTPVAAVVEPRPIPSAAIAGPVPLSPTRTPGRHVPAPHTLLATPGNPARNPLPWDYNVAGPRIANLHTRRVPITDPPLAQPWGLTGPTPLKAGRPLPPMVVDALSWLRRDPPPARRVDWMPSGKRRS
jgi:hypothetical protein